MNSEPTPLRMRAFRVIVHQGGIYSRWIVVEDVLRAQFRVGSYISFHGSTKGMEATLDRDDAWNVLHALSNVARFPEDFQNYWPVADCIDAAITQHEVRMRELWGQASQGTASGSLPIKQDPNDQESKPMIMATRGGDLSDEVLQQMINEVWDFAGGKKLKWKPIKRTPAGRKRDVLTFDGSKEVLVSATSVEIPSR